jgi:hypothetical protein
MRTTKREARILAGGLMVWVALVLAVPAGPAAAHELQKIGNFYYDEADRKLEPGFLDGSERYQPDVQATEDGAVWLAWLEFVPGEGDVIRLGRRAPNGEGWAEKRKLVAEPGRYARPTLTEGGDGTLWLSYEAHDPDQEVWRIHLRRRIASGGSGETISLSGRGAITSTTVSRRVPMAGSGSPGRRTAAGSST